MLRATATPRRLFWTLQNGGWLALVPLFTGLNFAAGNALDTAIFSGVVRQATGFALTLGLREIYRRWSWTEHPPWELGLRALPPSAWSDRVPGSAILRLVGEPRTSRCSASAIWSR